ncbi:hemerythrin domain-containing protein [Streptomyces sp. NPDC086549]|uniref:hemerythrin domain-containing protein n=1 Tax=Streptomyces sp. NPDC086549 TaxID=3365752 RepID=UPI003828652D
MSDLTFASAPEDAEALCRAEAHHARLAGELAGHVTLLLTTAGRDDRVAESFRAGLVAFCDAELLPYAAAEEVSLYPVARRLPDTRLLVESLIGEHRCLATLVDALRDAPTPAGAAAEARALQVLFEEHVAKQNGLVLPLLAAAPGVRLARLLRRLNDRVARATTNGGDTDGTGRAGDMKDEDKSGETDGCGCGCSCGA